MAALLTAERGNTDRLTVLIQECREMGIAVLGPDVNTSDALFTVVDAPSSDREMQNAECRMPNADRTAIRFGLAAVKNVGEHVVEAMVAERAARGPYRDLADLLSRVQDKDFNKKSLECLIQAGCLDRFGERGQLLANIEALLAYGRAVGHDAAVGQSNLFGAPGAHVELRLRPAEPVAQRLRLAWEKDLLGLYLSAHPFTSVSAALAGALLPITDVKDGGERVVVFGGIVTRVKRIVTKKGDPMLFAELEDATGSIEVVVFPRVLAATPQAWMAETAVLVRGNCSEKDGTPKVLADHAVQVVSGQERDALRALGGQPQAGSWGSGDGSKGSHAVHMRIVLDLPQGLAPERLLDLRARLADLHGTDAVYLKTANGRMVSTGLRVTLTPELRQELSDVLGAEAIREEREPERAVA
ncbi:hypothetical protein HY480_01280, partial [Candidatus Uhrbacteria bacterium]|nr:hypothetical protein [Candidatus Uhrbacteria bacterium]